MAIGALLLSSVVNTGSPTKHASTAASDLMVAVVSTDGNGGTPNFSTVTSGWTRRFQQVNGTAGGISVWTATGTASSPVFTTSGGTIMRSMVITVPGGDTTNPFGTADANITGSGASTSTAAYSAVSSSVRGSMLLHAVANPTTTIFSAIDFRELVLSNANSGGTTAANHEQLITVEKDYAESVSATTGRTAPTCAAAAWAQITGWIQPAAAAAFGLVQSTRFQGTGSNGTATFPASLTSGTLITVQGSAFTGATDANRITSVTYGGGATALTELVGRYTGSNEYAGIWYIANNANTTAATVTANRGGSDSLTFLCCEWKGAATSSPQDVSGANSGTSTAPAATTGTTAAGTELAISVISEDGNGTTITAPTTYSPHYIYLLGGVGQVPFGTAAREFTGGGTETATWTIGSSIAWEAVVGTFKAASSGTGYTSSQSGTIATAGTVNKQTGRRLTGTLTTAGAVLRVITRLLTATVATAGGIIKATARRLTGTLSTAGVLTFVRSYTRAPSGSVAAAGSLTRAASRTLTAATATAGSVVKQTRRLLSSSVATSGAMTGIRTFIRVVVGSVASAGTMTRATARTVTGTLPTAAAVTKATARRLTGTITSAGIVVGVRTYLRTLTGNLSTAGTLARSTARTLTATLTTAGASSRELARRLTGILTSAGVVTRQRTYMLTGAIPTAGTIARTTSRTLTATVAATGTIGRAIQRTVRGMVASAGSLLSDFRSGTIATPIMTFVAGARSMASAAITRATTTATTARSTTMSAAARPETMTATARDHAFTGDDQ